MNRGSIRRRVWLMRLRELRLRRKGRTGLPHRKPPANSDPAEKLRAFQQRANQPPAE